jgi:hypothetical protein
MPKSVTPRHSSSARSNPSPKGILKQRTLLDAARPLAPKGPQPLTRTSDIMHAMDIADEGPFPSQDNIPMDIQAPDPVSLLPITTNDTLLSPPPAPPSPTQNPVTPTTPIPPTSAPLPKPTPSTSTLMSRLSLPPQRQWISRSLVTRLRF